MKFNIVAKCEYFDVNLIDEDGEQGDIVKKQINFEIEDEQIRDDEFCNKIQAAARARCAFVADEDIINCYYTIINMRDFENRKLYWREK